MIGIILLLIDLSKGKGINYIAVLNDR